MPLPLPRLSSFPMASPSLSWKSCVPALAPGRYHLVQTPKNIGRSPAHSSAEPLGRHKQGDGSCPGSVNAEGATRRPGTEGGRHARPSLETEPHLEVPQGPEELLTGDGRASWVCSSRKQGSDQRWRDRALPHRGRCQAPECAVPGSTHPTLGLVCRGSAPRASGAPGGWRRVRKR